MIFKPINTVSSSYLMKFISGDLVGLYLLIYHFIKYSELIANLFLYQKQNGHIWGIQCITLCSSLNSFPENVLCTLYESNLKHHHNQQYESPIISNKLLCNLWWTLSVYNNSLSYGEFLFFCMREIHTVFTLYKSSSFPSAKIYWVVLGSFWS